MSDPLNKLVTFQARKKEGTFADYKVPFSVTVGNLRRRREPLKTIRISDHLQDSDHQLDQLYHFIHNLPFEPKNIVYHS